MMSISLGSLIHGRSHSREEDAKRLQKWQQRWAIDVPEHPLSNNNPVPPVPYVKLTGPSKHKASQGLYQETES